MITPWKKFITITTAGLLFAGISASSLAQEMKEAPLVGSLKDLRKLSKQLVAISQSSAEATVSLVSQRGGGAGSGVIVSSEGLILTAAHVVAALSDDVIVIFPDGSRKEAKKLGGDYDRDAAMVQITEEGDYPHAKVGKSRDLLRNEWCVALGHPGGFDVVRTPPVRLGRVLSNGQFITTDCAVVGGDSGGPLFDVNGKVIGIHSNIGATLTENRHVPIAVFVEKWETLKSGENTGRRFAGEQRVNPNRPVLGVNLADPGEGGGVHLESVMPESPAERAGLQAGDLVLKINGDVVNNARELIRAVGEFKVGDELSITYKREDKEDKVKVKLARWGDLMGEPERRERSRRGPRQERGEAPKAEEEPKEREGAKENNQEKNQEEVEKTKARIKELMEKSLKNGQLELDDEQLEKLGGIKELQKMLEELAETIGPDGLREMLELREEPDLFFASSMKALIPVTNKAAKSTVVVFVNGKPGVFGTVVSKEGHIITKNSETEKGKITRKVGEENLPLELVKRFPQRDLALFKGPGKDLEPVRWSGGKVPDPVGTLLTTPDQVGEPLGIGLVSVLTRPLRDVGFLGIQAGESDEGVRIKLTVEDGPAKKAGLKQDDVITQIDGQKFKGPVEFGEKIRSYRAGDEVEFTYRRGEKEAKLKVKLAARDQGRSEPRFRKMNEMSGPLSERLSGFPSALQHDIPLDPSMCGGPLLDLNGRCIGINVSRAGRVKTLAIPASDVRELLATTKGFPQANHAQSTPNPKARPTKMEDLMKERGKVLKELRAVEERLKKVEEELKSLKSG